MPLTECLLVFAGRLKWHFVEFCNGRYYPAVSNRRKSINRYQSIKLVNWYRLVSVNRWSINNHTKTVIDCYQYRHSNLKQTSRTLPVMGSSHYLSDHPSFLGSPGDQIGNARHCLSVSPGVLNRWKSMSGKPINQFKSIDKHTNLHHLRSLIVNINQLIGIDCHRLSISSIGYATE